MRQSNTATRKRHLVNLAVCCALLAASAAAHAGTMWSIETLAYLADTTFIARDLNNHGQVVGYGSDYKGGGKILPPYQDALLYEDGALQDLGGLSDRYTSAEAINNSGVIAGYSYAGSRNTQAVIYKDGQVIQLNPTANYLSAARAINDNGQVVGVIRDGTYDTAVLWDNGSLIRLGTLGFTSSAVGINNAGTVIGWSETVQHKYQSFVWQNGVMTNLGALGENQFSNATAINESGIIIGNSQVIGESFYHGYIYKGGKMEQLLSEADGNAYAAYDINNRGWVVGMGQPLNGGRSFGYLYDGTDVINLNLLPSVADSGWWLTDVSDINDAGQILGTGLLNGVSYSFLLTPHHIPIPSTGLLLLTGIGLLAVRKRAATVRAHFINTGHWTS